MPRHYRKKRTTGRRKRRIKGRGLFSWIKKAAKWAAKNGLKAFKDPRVRSLASTYGPAGTDKMIQKGDDVLKLHSLVSGAMGKGRRRVRIRRRGRGLCGRGLGGRGLGGRGLGGRP